MENYVDYTSGEFGSLTTVFAVRLFLKLQAFHVEAILKYSNAKCNHT